jgi:hypothetical protein
MLALHSILYTEEEEKCNHENMEKINFTRQGDKQMRMRKTSKSTPKMTVIATYLSIITLTLVVSVD